VRDRHAVAAIIHGGGQQFGIRPGTENVPGIVGLAQAVELAAAEQADLAPRVRSLRDELERRLLEVVPDAVINGWQAERAPHVCNVSIPGTDSEALLMHLDLAGIACSSGSACSTGAVEPSHVLTAMGVPRELGVAALRFSFGKDNTVEDVEAVVAVLPRIIETLQFRIPHSAFRIGVGGPRWRSAFSSPCRAGWIRPWRPRCSWRRGTRSLRRP